MTYYEITKLRDHEKLSKAAGKHPRCSAKIKCLESAGLERGWIASKIHTQHDGHGKLKASQLDVRRSGIDLSVMKQDASEHCVPLVSIQSQLKSMELDVPAQQLRNLLKDRASEGR